MVKQYTYIYKHWHGHGVISSYKNDDNNNKTNTTNKLENEREKSSTKADTAIIVRLLLIYITIKKVFIRKTLYLFVCFFPVETFSRSFSPFSSFTLVLFSFLFFLLHFPNHRAYLYAFENKLSRWNIFPGINLFDIFISLIYTKMKYFSRPSLLMVFSFITRVEISTDKRCWIFFTSMPRGTSSEGNFCSYRIRCVLDYCSTWFVLKDIVSWNFILWEVEFFCLTFSKKSVKILQKLSKHHENSQKFWENVWNCDKNWEKFTRKLLTIFTKNIENLKKKMILNLRKSSKNIVQMVEIVIEIGTNIVKMSKKIIKIFINFVFDTIFIKIVSNINKMTTKLMKIEKNFLRIIEIFTKISKNLVKTAKKSWKLPKIL